MSTKFRATTLTLAVSVALGTMPSYAAEAANSVKEEQVEKIVVVGSRGAPRSVSDSPVPVDLIGAEELERSGNTNMLELLKSTVPSFNVHEIPISDAASLIKPANLRGLSSDSTLILVNGKRRHRASVIALLGGGINDGAQGPDISVIPSSALKQVEILRDGAAAQYGSDAIAGVINFVLKDDADGGHLTVRYGSYYEGDGDSMEVSGNIGMPLTDDGFANISFQYKNADATSRSVQRPDAQGLIDAGNTAVSPLTQIWGSPEINDDITIFGNFGLDLGNDNEAYMFTNYSERDVRGGFYYRNPHTRSGVYGGQYRTVDGYLIKEPNKDDFPVLNKAWKKAPGTILVGDVTGDMSGNCPMDIVAGDNVLDNPRYVSEVANNPNCFAFNELLPGGFTPNFGGNIVDTAITFGTRGESNYGFMYDVSGSLGRNQSTYVIYDTLNASLGPSTPRDFEPGKHTQLEKTFNLDVNKDIDIDSMESLFIAGGYEWHSESFEVTAGDVASFTAGPYTEQGFGIGSNGFPGFKPVAAGVYSRQNWALYADVEARFTDRFMMGYALRYEDYSSFGSDTNYKITAQYELTDNLSFRGSVSTGFRAPTVGQANYSNVQTSIDHGGNLVDSALLPPTNPIAIELDATELTPEESQSYTLGAVYNQGNFFMTVDYYNISVEDRISQSEKKNLTDTQKQTLKAAGVPNVDSIQQISFFTNDFNTTTEGLDVIANYNTELMGGDTLFSMAYNYNETTVDKYSAITGDFTVSRLENDLPNHRGTFTWSQSYEDFSFFARANYYGEYQGVHGDIDATVNTGEAAITLDAEFSYFVSEDLSLSIGAQNLLDQEATKINFTGQNNLLGGVYYETSPFGFNGGFYYIKATYNF